MSPRRWKSNDEVWLFIVIPIIVAFAIYIIGVLLQKWFGVPDVAKALFWAIGGVAFFASYFREQIGKLIRRHR